MPQVGLTLIEPIAPTVVRVVLAMAKVPFLRAVRQRMPGGCERVTPEERLETPDTANQHGRVSVARNGNGKPATLIWLEAKISGEKAQEGERFLALAVLPAIDMETNLGKKGRCVSQTETTCG